MEEIGLGEFHSQSTDNCPLCGWRLWTYSGDRGIPESQQVCKILKQFNINSDGVGIDELGAHLKSHFSDIYALEWRRFEELAEDVFKNQGFETVLTCPSNDGGADVLLLERRSDRIQAIVECKKYSASRKVGVSLVRNLVGAAVEWDTRQAFLVTTSDFTRGAKLAAKSFRNKGYAISLVGSTELLSALGVYNVSLPRLEDLTKEKFHDIIQYAADA